MRPLPPPNPPWLPSFFKNKTSEKQHEISILTASTEPSKAAWMTTTGMATTRMPLIRRRPLATSRLQTFFSVLIVNRPFVRVTQYLVSFRNFSEFCFRFFLLCRIFVLQKFSASQFSERENEGGLYRMILKCQFMVGLLQSPFIYILGNLQNFVQVPGL